MEAFLKHIAATLKLSDLELLPSHRLVDLPNWDSLAVLTTISMLDREYGVEIDGPGIISCETLGDLYNRVLGNSPVNGVNPDKQDIEELVTISLVQLRKDLALPEQKEMSPTTAIYGRDSDLDSLAIVHLVVDVEARLKQAYRKSWVLADERALSRNHSPFRTVGTLCDFIIASTPG